jgi:hypothetical protein
MEKRGSSPEYDFIYIVIMRLGLNYTKEIPIWIFQHNKVIILIVSTLIGRCPDFD